MDGCTHTLNQRHGLILAFAQLFFCQFYDFAVTKLLMLQILCLVQTIRKQEDGGLWRNDDLLQGVFPVGKHAYRQVGIARQYAYTLPYQQWRIMTCIALAQYARLQIEHTHKHCDKHDRIIALAHRLIKCLSNNVRFWNMCRHVAEQ